MRRAIKQIIILAIFLFLAAFSSVWFSTEEDKPETFIATANTANKAWGLVEAIARLASPSSSSMAAGVREEVALIAIDNKDILVDGIAAQIAADEAMNTIKQKAAPIKAVAANEGFFGFVRDVFAHTPERYLDVKLYSRGLREFFTFYWLEVKSLN